MKQRTILREVSISGKSLHTGEEVQLTLKPAAVNHGIVFQRIDLFGKPELKPLVEFVTDLVRSTTIADGHAKVNTVEHVLSALNGCGVDNVLVEMNASEPPILDGSAKHFVNLIQQAEPVEQDAEREYFVLDEPISVTRGASSIIALPHDGFRVTCTSTDDRGIHTQHLSLDIDPESYVAQVAPARTFTIYEDIEELLKLGKIKGGSLDSAIVIKGDKILSKEPLRFKEEFVRHKILDIVGDIALVGCRIRAHVVAERPSHRGNVMVARRLRRLKFRPADGTPVLEAERIFDFLPHRYPFLMVDRILEFEPGRRIVGLKNVTINEPFFNGHFPSHPIMPGVLIVEGMAQTGGLLLMNEVPDASTKVVYFMSMNDVKFRRPVHPGDQLQFEMEMLQYRGRVCRLRGVGTVKGQVVAEATLMAQVVDR